MATVWATLQLSEDLTVLIGIIISEKTLTMEPIPGKQKTCNSYGVQVKLEVQISCKATELCGPKHMHALHIP